MVPEPPRRASSALLAAFRRFPLLGPGLAALAILAAFIWMTERSSDTDKVATDAPRIAVEVGAVPASTATTPVESTTPVAPTPVPEARVETTTTAALAPEITAPPVTPPSLVFVPPPPTAAPSPPTSPAGGHVSPGSLGGRAGPGAEPGAAYDGPLEITEPGTVIDGVVVQGCLRIRASSVTIRNSVINCVDAFSVEARDVSGLTVQRTRVDCTGSDWAAFHLANTQFTLDGLEVTNCGDPLYTIGALGASSFTNSVMWHPVLGSGAHYDGIQIGSSGYATGSLLVAGNWMAADGPGCCYNAAVFVDGGSIEVTVRNNWIDGAYGYYPVRCYTETRCRVESNVVGGAVDSFVLASSSVPVIVRCNVLEGGAPVPDDAYVAEGGSFAFEPCG